MSEIFPEQPPAVSGTAPGRAAYEAFMRSLTGRCPDVPVVLWERLDDLARDGWASGDTQADWDAAAQAVLNAAPPELAAAMAETRQLRAQLVDAHSETRSFLARIDALARELEASAARTAPSKKSDIEAATARRLRAITLTDPAIDTAAVSGTVSVSPRLPLPDESREAYEAYLDTLFAPVRAEVDRLRAGSAITPAGTEHIGPPS